MTCTYKNCGRRNNPDGCVLMCSSGCLHWFHGCASEYDCVGKWLKHQCNTDQINTSNLKNIDLTNPDFECLNNIGLENVTRTIKCPTEGCDSLINRFITKELMKRCDDRWCPGNTTWDTFDFYSDNNVRKMMNAFSQSIQGVISRLLSSRINHILRRLIEGYATQLRWMHSEYFRMNNDQRRYYHYSWRFRNLSQEQNLEYIAHKKMATAVLSEIKKRMQPDIFRYEYRQ